LGLTILNGELDSDTETLPCRGSLGDIFTDFFRRLCERRYESEKVAGLNGSTYQAERTDFWGEGGRGTNLTSGGTEIDDLNFVGILSKRISECHRQQEQAYEFGCHGGQV
jgi:hypothetical protein